MSLAFTFLGLLMKKQGFKKLALEQSLFFLFGPSTINSTQRIPIQVMMRYDFFFRVSKFLYRVIMAIIMLEKDVLISLFFYFILFCL